MRPGDRALRPCRVHAMFAWPNLPCTSDASESSLQSLSRIIRA